MKIGNKHHGDCLRLNMAKIVDAAGVDDVVENVEHGHSGNEGPNLSVCWTFVMAYHGRCVPVDLRRPT
jgi:hypothetical protein